MSYKIQRYVTTVTLPLNDDTHDAPVLTKDLNGVLRGITVNAPDLTGTSLTLSILGMRGEVLFSKDLIVENALSHIWQDSNNVPLAIALALQSGVSPVRIKSVGTPNATGTLTFDNAGAINDGDTVTVGDQTYRAKLVIAQANDFLITPDVVAIGTITSDNTNPDAGGTVTVDDQTYTFVGAFSAAPTVANEILIGASADDTLTNLQKAINGTGTEGVEYSVGTLQPSTSVIANAVAAHAITVEATEGGADGNSIVFEENATHISVDGAGFLGGTQAGVWNGDSTLQNLSDAINLEDGAGEKGVKYHADTVANQYVTAADVSDHAIVLTAVEAVEAGADVATTETASHLAFGAATLTGGGEAAQRVFNVDLLIER